MEQTAQQSYNAAMDSVNLILQGQPEGMEATQWADVVERNKEHLRIQITKGTEFYGDLDLTPFESAVA